jgi:DNA replicative helicase MCM subunit Mcm2 (Cdc46/Mcm family)
MKYARKSVKTDAAVPSNDVLEIKIENLKQTPIGTMVKVRGTVSQNPGVFDQQLMYLAGSGVGVYLSQGVFPELAIGDTVTVTGVSAKPSKEFFIVAAGPEDIVKDGTGDIPTPHQINISEITEENIGWLVSVEGEITKKEKDYLTLKDGEKQLEILLAKETILKSGNRVIVTGIVSINGDNLRILASDVELVSGETLTIQNNIKNSVINRWKEVVSVFFFSCAAVIFVYTKIKPRKTEEIISQTVLD